jgi:hypothetical protein
MTTQFQVGQEYKINAVEFITVSRRTEVSVWFIQNGKEIRRKIQISGYGENKVEFVNFQDRSLYAIKTTVTSNEPQDTLNETTTESQVKGWEYINKQAQYENRRNPYYAVFSKLSTAAYNDEFYGLYFQKIYNWIDEKTSKQLDVFVTEFKDIDPKSHYINYYYRAMELYQKTPLGNPNKTTS